MSLLLLFNPIGGWFVYTDPATAWAEFAAASAVTWGESATATTSWSDYAAASTTWGESPTATATSVWDEYEPQPGGG